MDRCKSRPLPSLFPHRPPGSANRTQRETPLLDRVCGEVRITDPAHALYGQTLPQLPVRINRRMPHVMVLLPSGRRHRVPRAATNLEREGVAVSPTAPLPSISVRTILPLARLVQQLKQAKEESHAEQTASTSLPPIPVAPVLTTIFHQLPQSHQQQLAHLIADLIRRMRAAKHNREGDHEC